MPLDPRRLERVRAHLLAAMAMTAVGCSNDPEKPPPPVQIAAPPTVAPPQEAPSHDTPADTTPSDASADDASAPDASTDADASTPAGDAGSMDAGHAGAPRPSKLPTPIKRQSPLLIQVRPHRGQHGI